ncbi:MAG: AtpZ/AtpI family protein [Bacteroidales bacterium]|nr:AtpZ/AtpI family protein [Bacteroidales bacterium]
MNNQKKPPSPKTKNLNTYARYSSLAFEMFFIMLGCVYGGIKLDALLNSKPLLTASLSFLGVILAIWFALKDILRKQKNE